VKPWLSSILLCFTLMGPARSYAEPYQNFNFTVREPWLSDIKNGTKDVEGRLDRGVFSKIRTGDRILWNGECLVRVTFVDHYTSIVEMLVMEGLKHLLPGVTSFEKAVAIYDGFYHGQTNNTPAIGIGMALVPN